MLLSWPARPRARKAGARGRRFYERCGWRLSERTRFDQDWCQPMACYEREL